MQYLKEIVLPNYPLVLSVLKYRNVWVFWNKKKIVLLNYPLGLSLLKYRNMWVFWNKKKSGSNRCSPLNIGICVHYLLGNIEHLTWYRVLYHRQMQNLFK